MTAFMAAFLPMVSGHSSNYSVCSGEEKDSSEDINWPSVAPVYNSYYDYSTNELHIYGSYLSTALTIEVTYEGKVVLSDVVVPGDQHVVYDFTGSEVGRYWVTVTSGTTMIRTFCFEVF